MPIETIIDCGLGELFVIRTMGAQVDEAAIGSVEYALLNFNCELILILGSAFSASLRVTMESESSPIKKETPAIQKLIKKVKPLLKKSKLRAGYLGDLSKRSSDRDRVIHFASQFMLQQTESEMIQGSPLIQDRVALGLLKIVKGTYGFSTGQISLLADKETKALVSAENIVKEATTLATKANEIIGDINSQHKKKLRPSEILELLYQGNLRFSQGLRLVSASVDTSSLQQSETMGQAPLATILTCSDSRLPTETLFNLGLGSFYVLRVAGNVLTELSLAGIEYSVRNFNVPLIYVLGHTQCGAIKASRELKNDQEGLSRNIEAILERIEVSVNQTESDTAIKNVENQIRNIKASSSLVRQLIENKKLMISGGIYKIESGVVESV
jgi:carbonic anhydrase